MRLPSHTHTVTCSVCVSVLLAVCLLEACTVCVCVCVSVLSVSGDQRVLQSLAQWLPSQSWSSSSLQPTSVLVLSLVLVSDILSCLPVDTS